MSPRISMSSARSRWTVLGLICLIASAGCAANAKKGSTLTLLAAGATQAAVTAELGAFQTQTGLVVNVTYGSAGKLRDALLGGTAADVAIVTPAVITALDGKQLMRDGSRVDLGQVGGGLAVRTGGPVPTISTADDLKQALLAADEVYYADPKLSTAGAALMTICDSFGIGDQVRAKGHFAAGGKEAMQLMARSKAPTVLGATQISEILSVPEVKLIGGYPDALQVKTTYSAIILANTAVLKDAQQLVQFLSGPEFQARLKQSGFEPAPAARK